MCALSEIRFWYAYNSHVRKSYLRAIVSLPRDEALKDRGASYPSILDIFVHVLDAYRRWFSLIAKDRSGTEFTRWRGNMQIDHLKERELEVDRMVSDTIDSLTAEDLCAKIMNGRFEMRDLLNHMIEEELQHRGEMNALFWQMDVDPPISGLDDAKYINMHLSGERCPRCE